MNTTPSPRRGFFFTRFLAGLLILGQLVWGPASARGSLTRHLCALPSGLAAQPGTGGKALRSMTEDKVQAGLEEALREDSEADEPLLTRRGALAALAAAPFVMGAQGPVPAAQPHPRQQEIDRLRYELREKIYERGWLKPPPGLAVATNESLQKAERLIWLWRRFQAHTWHLTEQHYTAALDVHQRYFEQFQREMWGTVRLPYTPQNFDRLFTEELEDYAASLGVFWELAAPEVIPTPEGKPLLAFYRVPPFAVKVHSTPVRSKAPVLEGKEQEFWEVRASIFYSDEHLPPGFSVGFSRRGTVFILDDVIEQQLNAEAEIFKTTAAHKDLGFWDEVAEAEKGPGQPFYQERNHLLAVSAAKLFWRSPPDREKAMEEYRRAIRYYQAQMIADQQDESMAQIFRRSFHGEPDPLAVVQRRARGNELRAAPRRRLLMTLRELAIPLPGGQSDQDRIPRDGHLLNLATEAILTDPDRESHYGMRIDPSDPRGIPEAAQVLGQLYQLAVPDPEDPERFPRAERLIAALNGMPVSQDAPWLNWMNVTIAAGSGVVGAWAIRRAMRRHGLRRGETAAPERTQAGLEEDALLRAVRNAAEDWDAAEEAAVQLGQSGSSSAVDTLRRIVQDSAGSAESRAVAALGLGIKGDPRHLVWLVGMIVEPEASVLEQMSAATALSLLYYRDPESALIAQGAVARLWNSLKEKPALLRKAGDLREEMAEIMDRLNHHGGRTVLERIFMKEGVDLEAFVEVALDPDTSEEERQLAQWVLKSWNWPDEKRRAGIIEQIEGDADPFFIPMLILYLRGEIERDPGLAGGDFEDIAPRTTAIAELARLTRSPDPSGPVEPLDQSRVVRALRAEAVEFARKDLIPAERFTDPFLRQAVERHWNWAFPKKTAGLEEGEAALQLLLERWHGWRSLAEKLTPVVVSARLAETHPELKQLAQIEPYLLVDRGVETVPALIALDAHFAYYYGVPEEARAFAEIAGEAFITIEQRPPIAQTLLEHLAQILSLVGIREGVLAAGLEEFLAGLEAVATGA